MVCRACGYPTAIATSSITTPRSQLVTEVSLSTTDPHHPAIHLVNPRSSRFLPRLLRTNVFLMCSIALIGLLTTFCTYVYYARDLPRILSFDEHSFEGVTTILADDGNVIAELYGERRFLLPYEKLPRTLILAFLATEDSRFFSHEGLDFIGIARAAIKNLMEGQVVEGGSTITQQLAKASLGNARSLRRKAREAILARRMEHLYTKEQILLLYLNQIFLGHHSYGVQAASQNYFRKNVWELTLGEIAMLAGLPQAPSRINPQANLPASLERRRTVLRRMVDEGFITEAAAKQADNEPVVVFPLRDDMADKVPHYADRVRRQLRETLGDDWLRRGAEVYSAASVRLGLAANRALNKRLEIVDKRHGYRGPLLKETDSATRATILQRNAVYLNGSPKPESVAIGIVTAIDKTGLSVSITPSFSGKITSDSIRWAGAYDPGKSNNGHPGNTASFDPRLVDPNKAFRVGDVILVRVGPSANGITNLDLFQQPQVEGAFLAVDHTNGQVKALIGGADFDRSKVDRTQSLRQTGSTMKVVVYSKAYDMGLAPSTLFSGAPVNIEGYKPSGYRAVPDMTLWDALSQSENNISLRVHQYVLKHTSLADYQNWAKRLGLTHPLMGYPSEVLGTDQTLQDMVTAFGVFAKAGVKPQQNLIRKVVTHDGLVLWRNLALLDSANTFRDTMDSIYDHLSTAPAPVIDPTTAYLTGQNMMDVMKRGTGHKGTRQLDFPMGGKTGTLPYDVWFIGFSPQYVAGAWVGMDTRERPLGKSKQQNMLYGADTALPIWTDWMKQAHPKGSEMPLLADTPNGVDWVKIDPTTGLRARDGGVSIPHRSGTAPERFATGPGSSERFIGESEFDF